MDPFKASATSIAPREEACSSGPLPWRQCSSLLRLLGLLPLLKEGREQAQLLDDQAL